MEKGAGRTAIRIAKNDGKECESISRNRGSYEYKEENRQKLLHKMSNSNRIYDF